MSSHASDRSVDPHWDLALEIADQLWHYAEYVVDVDPRPTQRLVDLQWAAHQAGRIIGVKTKVEIGPYARTDPTVTVRVTYVDPDGRGLARAQDGMDALLRSVRRHQVARAHRVGFQRHPPP